MDGKKTNNSSGKPLSSSKWLLEHHIAKLKERKEFLEKILVDIKPRVIVDLGCATGLWLELANDIVDENCELIGVDLDKNAIVEAKKRSKKWNRKVSFIHNDFTNIDNLPSADIYFAFNVFSYVQNSDALLEKIRLKLNDNGKLILRQYDGAGIKFGPMEHKLRLSIEKALFNSLCKSEFFKHYDLDRIYDAVDNSKFTIKNVDLELFKKTSPYTKNFLTYFNNTINWTSNYLDDNNQKKILNWHSLHLKKGRPSYFYEVDLVAILTP